MDKTLNEIVAYMLKQQYTLLSAEKRQHVLEDLGIPVAYRFNIHELFLNYLEHN